MKQKLTMVDCICTMTIINYYHALASPLFFYIHNCSYVNNGFSLSLVDCFANYRLPVNYYNTQSLALVKRQSQNSWKKFPALYVVATSIHFSPF